MGIDAQSVNSGHLHTHCGWQLSSHHTAGSEHLRSADIHLLHCVSEVRTANRGHVYSLSQCKTSSEVKLDSASHSSLRKAH
eukprot:6461817-Amphidinium_carterae.1